MFMHSKKYILIYIDSDETARDPREARADAHPRPQLVRAAVVRDVGRRAVRGAHVAHHQPQVMSGGVGGAPARTSTVRSLLYGLSQY